MLMPRFSSRSRTVMSRDKKPLSPSFTCAALRLEALQNHGEARGRLLRQALGLARRWKFPLEEGLIQAELARLDADPDRYQVALERLEEAGARARIATHL